MALAPSAAADPAASLTEPMLDAGAEAGAGPVTICTVMKNPDGSFSLQGAAPTAMEGEAPAEAAPQTFDSAGPLLNAINDLLEGASGTEGDPRQQAFNSGYGGAPNGTPTR